MKKLYDIAVTYVPIKKVIDDVEDDRFDEIPREMQKLRLPQKPGCIPPYIAYNRESDVVSLLQAEKEYIEDKIKNPLTTDIKCFFKAIFNIVILHKRSA